MWIERLFAAPLVNHPPFSSFIINEMFVHCIKLAYKKSVNSQSPCLPHPHFPKPPNCTISSLNKQPLNEFSYGSSTRRGAKAV